MSKKLFIGLAPLLAVAAFAVMPVAAQAVTQHWYRSGVIIPQGEAVPFVMFGGEINLGQQSAFLFGSEVNCKTVAGGTIENPGGGGAGVGSMTALASYECKGARCEEQILIKFGVPGREWVEAKNMPASINGDFEQRSVPWPMQLEESTVAGVSSIRVKIGQPFVKFEKPSPPGMIRVRDACDIAPETLIEMAEFEGELKPEIGQAKTGNLNGTSPGKPSQAKFNGASTGALHSSVGGEGTYTGNLKYLGYDGQELITVKP